MADEFKSAVSFNGKRKELTIRLPDEGEFISGLLFREVAEAIFRYTQQDGPMYFRPRLNQIARQINDCCTDERL